ncbi:MAG: DUF484 family protein [Pseudomonadota bacterium]
MSSEQTNPQEFRDAILADPGLVLDDSEVMARLLGVSEDDGTVVDLRGALVERLKDQLGALEETHRTVLAAAYDNVAGTQAVHRAVLTVLDQPNFIAFLGCLGGTLSDDLGVDAAVLLVEEAGASEPSRPIAGMMSVPAGDIALYRGDLPGIEPRSVVLRPCDEGAALFGKPEISSEAILQLSLGEGRPAAALILGAYDAARFGPDQGTELLRFFADVFERCLNRWLG